MSQVLAEWNGVDTSQWEDAGIGVDGAGGPDPSDMTLTVISEPGAIAGRVLRLIHDGTFSGGRGMMWLLKKSEVTLPSRYLIEMAVYGLTPASGRAGGVAFLVDEDAGAGVFGHAYHCVDDAAVTRWQANDQDNFSTNVGGIATNAGGIVRLDVTTTFGAVPRFELYGFGTNRFVSGAGVAAASYAMGHEVVDTVAGTYTDWTGIVPDRVGLSLFPVSGTVGGDYLDIASFRVLDPLASGAALDETAPIVSFGIASGTTITRHVSLPVTVTEETAIRRTVIGALFASGDFEVVYDGAAFAKQYFSSTREAVEGGYLYTVRRSGGWPTYVSLKVFAIDTAGNEGS